MNEIPIILLFQLTTPGNANVLTCSKDGKFLFAGISQSIYVWQTVNGRLLAILKAHYQEITNIQITQDGSRFISASNDGAIHVWNLLDVLEKDLMRLPGARELTSHHEPQPVFSFNQSSLQVSSKSILLSGYEILV